MREGVLEALCEHAMKTSSSGGMKRVTVEFVARLLLVGIGCFKGDFEPDCRCSYKRIDITLGDSA